MTHDRKSAADSVVLERVPMGAAVIVLQIASLWLINAACYAIVTRTHLAIPGNVLGLVVLYALFVSKIVPISWFERSASLLVKHLAFFFIPITVGLMDAGTVLARDGVGIFTTLVVSSAAGFLFAGLVSQRLRKVDRASRLAVETAS